jgi:hypothetical protein
VVQSRIRFLQQIMTGMYSFGAVFATHTHPSLATNTPAASRRVAFLRLFFLQKTSPVFLLGGRGWFSFLGMVTGGFCYRQECNVL